MLRKYYFYSLQLLQIRGYRPHGKHEGGWNACSPHGLHQGHASARASPSSFRPKLPSRWKKAVGWGYPPTGIYSLKRERNLYVSLCSGTSRAAPQLRWEVCRPPPPAPSSQDSEINAESSSCLRRKSKPSSRTPSRWLSWTSMTTDLPALSISAFLKWDGGWHVTLSQKVKILLNLTLIELHHFLTCLIKIQLWKPTDNLNLREEAGKLISVLHNH